MTTDAEGQKYRKRYNRNTFSADFRLGVKAGANFSTWQGDQWYFDRDADGLQTIPYPVRSYDLSLGYHGGIYADILLKRRFHIQLEAVYSRMGTRFDRLTAFCHTNYGHGGRHSHWCGTAGIFYYTD